MAEGEYNCMMYRIKIKIVSTTIVKSLLADEPNISYNFSGDIISTDGNEQELILMSETQGPILNFLWRYYNKPVGEIVDTFGDQIEKLDAYTVEVKRTKITREFETVYALNQEDAEELADDFVIEADSSMAQTGQGEREYTEVVLVSFSE
jgi:hypothetical protein